MVVTILVVLHDRKDFITKHACWCRGDGALFVTFLAIIGLILLVIKLSLSTRIINILMTGPSTNTRDNIRNCRFSLN